MESQVKKLIENEFREISKLKEEQLLKEKLGKEQTKQRAIKKTINTLKEEENTLKNHLEKLKKENFSLETSIYSWQITLTKNLKEFKLAEQKLNELYREIWSEREKFCSDVDNFNAAYGIFSNSWHNQLNFILDSENLKIHNVEDKKCKEEIEILQKEIKALKKQIETKKETLFVSTVMVQKSNETKTTNTAREEFIKTLPGKHNTSENLMRNSATFLDQEDIIEVCQEKFSPPKNELFSFMDINKVRMIKKIRQKNTILKKIK